MNHWSFVIAAYAVALVGTAVLLIASWRAMRAAEAKAAALRERA
ncbi:heme exporter protein CcmD [Sphingomonas sabuli]|uniref:Heme exporter protein D n=1 Tax=Sphingomonas sabuli TaxID=2764186 RepID=A0A7G9L3R2_9SPHN|nr:heme exporter protein CcmD [Sphingomonas sabuli]QNM83261.1 heme exporter protein CcmD [Sphingomonas sabuli]